MSKVYGLWNERGWFQSVNGEIIHSGFPQVMAALKHNNKHDSAEVREIGHDGLPVEATDGKQIRPQSDKAIHGPDADK